MHNTQSFLQQCLFIELFFAAMLGFITDFRFACQPCVVTIPVITAELRVGNVHLQWIQFQLRLCIIMYTYLSLCSKNYAPPVNVSVPHNINKNNQIIWGQSSYKLLFYYLLFFWASQWLLIFLVCNIWVWLPKRIVNVVYRTRNSGLSLLCIHTSTPNIELMPRNTNGILYHYCFLSN